MTPFYSIPFSERYRMTPEEYAQLQAQQGVPQAPSGAALPVAAAAPSAIKYGISQITGPSAPVAPATPEIISASRIPASAAPASAATGGMFSSYFPAGSEIAGMGTISQAALPFAGAAGAYQLYKNWGQRKPLNSAAGGAAAGAALGSVIPGAGTLLGAGVGGALGGLAGMLKTGKHKDQVARDGIRTQLQQVGLLDDDFNVSLADGSRYNMGRDGSVSNYNIDQSKPMAAQAVGWADPLAEIVSGGDDKLRSDFAGEFANAAMSNAGSLEGVRGNILAMMERMGLNETSVRQNISALLNDGRITQEQHDAYQNSIGTLIKGDPKLYVTTAPQTQAPTAETPVIPTQRPQVTFSQQVGGQNA